MDEVSQYGLIGYPLGHSFSEAYFADRFARGGIRNASYRNFPLENIRDLPALLASNPAIRGFNVTIPYKQQIIPYIDRLHPTAQAVGAVNCVGVERDGSLTGYNTDAPAFRDELLKLIGRERPAALVLGSGGASKAVCYALRGLEMDYSVVSRSPARGGITYDGVTPGVIRTHRLIINTTPLGMFPDVESAPDLPYEELTPAHFLFDLVYNPPLTEFLRRGGRQGAKTANGLGMLVRQAELSWDVWMGSHTP